MDLFFHLLLHLMTSLAAGYIVWKIWGQERVAFAAALVGGVLIDLDHFLDYFLAFGWNFRLDYFAKGYQFLKSDKIHVLFHGWEYGIILVVLSIWVLKNKTAKSVILALALGIFFHLSVDLLTNDGTRFSTYSILNRIENNFELEKLVTPEHYSDHQARKKLIYPVK